MAEKNVFNNSELYIIIIKIHRYQIYNCVIVYLHFVCGNIDQIIANLYSVLFTTL